MTTTTSLSPTKRGFARRLALAAGLSCIASALLFTALPSARANHLATGGPAVTQHEQALGASSLAPTPAWSEERYLLGNTRWWIAADWATQLRTAASGTLDATARWAVPGGRDDGITEAERDQLTSALAETLRAAMSSARLETGRHEDSAGDPAGGAAAGARPAAQNPEGLDSGGSQDTDEVVSTSRADRTSRHGFAVRARIVETWRPNRLLNVLIVAPPGPGAPFVTQGGAALEVDIIDVARDIPVAGFQCRQYAGILQFLNAFGRVGHAKAALCDCASSMFTTLREGRPPASLLALPTGEPGGPPPLQDRGTVAIGAPDLGTQ